MIDFHILRKKIDLTEGKESRISPSSDDDNHSLVLPVPKSDFSEFLRNILSGKDEIEFEFHNEIIIDDKLINDLIGSLDYRVQSANLGELISREVQVSFSDGKKYRSNDLSKVLNHRPFGGARTRFFRIRSLYFIKFPSSSTPIQQEVDIRFKSDDGSYLSIDSGSTGSIKVLIRYSEISWAEDISNLLKGVLRSRISSSDTEDFSRSTWISTHRTRILVLLSFALLISYCTGMLWMNRMAVRSLELEASRVQSIQDISLFLSKIAINSSPASSAISFTIFLLIGAFFIIIFNYIMLILLRGRERSCIFNLYEPDKTHINYLKERGIRGRIYAFIGFILSLVSGVGASYIYAYLSS